MEVLCKWLFADLAPKAIVTRGRERREARRFEEAKAKVAADTVAREQREVEKIREAEALVESKKTR